MIKLLDMIQAFNSILWGVPLPALLLGCGIYLTIKLRFIQFRKFKYGVKSVLRNIDETSVQGDVSGISSFFLALASTVGIGNVIGVAAAIKIGGAGALFWMWVTGFLGMAIQYSEALLAVKYRVMDSRGYMLGGPMIYLEKGLNKPLLGKIFALFAIGSTFVGSGNIPQSKTIIEMFNQVFNIPIPVTSAILGIVIAILAYTGIKNLTRMAVITIPFIIVLYLFGALVLILLNINLLPGAVLEILSSAFSMKSLNGGIMGSAIAVAINQGVMRGVSSNHAGVGSAAIAAATARTSFAAHQGAMFMMVTFVDTIIINTVTGILILISGVHKLSIASDQMIFRAFDISLENIGFGEIILTVSIVFFAFTTLIIWQYYGERCTMYLFGEKAVPVYKILFIAIVMFSGYIRVDVIWFLASIGDAMMAIPNLLALLMLSPIVIQETKMYFRDF